MEALPPSSEEVSRLREAVSGLERVDFAQGGRAQFEAVLDEIAGLRRIAASETVVILTNLRNTTVRLLLRRLPTVDRTNEDECIALFQLLWFRLLPQVIEEAKRNPELIRAFDQFRNSNQTFRSSLFDLLGKRAERYAQMVKSDA
jgi:hypothetical protein